MGVKFGSFINRTGDEIIVSFSGEKVVEDKSLVFGTTPVVLSMNGTAGEFVPIKYTTGTITLVVREGDGLDLMTSHIEDVRVTVRNKTQGEYLFLGFVSPNTFSQNFDSELNEFSVEVVDFLGAAKHILYPFDGLRVRSLREVITRMLQLYFYEIDELIVPKTLRLCAGVGTTDETSKYTTRYMEMQVSELAFVETVDPFLPRSSAGTAGGLVWPAGEITCYDVLEKIANSLLFTLVQDGSRWMFVDDLQTRNAASRAYIAYVTDSQWSFYEESEGENLVGGEYNAIPATFRDKGVSVSSVPKFGKFTIKNAYESEVPIYPSLFSEELLTAAGQMRKFEGEGDEVAKQWQNQENLCYDLTTPTEEGDNYIGARIVAQADLDTEVLAGVPVQRFSNFRKWDKRLLLYVPRSADKRLLLKKKAQFPIAVAPRSGIGIYIKMNAGVVLGYAKDNAPTKFLSNDGSCKIFKARVRVGDFYYDAVPTPDYEHDLRLYFWLPEELRLNTAGIKLDGSASSKWFWINTRTLATTPAGEYAVWDLNDWNDGRPVGGDVEVELYAAENAETGLTVVINSFEVGLCTGYADKASYSAQDLEKDIVLYTSQGAEPYREHELPLNVCFACCRGYLSPFIDRVNYAEPIRVNDDLGSYRGFRSYIAYYYDVYDRSTSYGTSINRLAKLVNAGAGYSTELSVLDDFHTPVKPYTRVNYQNSLCHIVSWEKDIINNVARIVIV